MIESKFKLTLLLAVLLLSACGGGGGDRAKGVVSGPTEPGQPITPPTPVLPGDSIALGDVTAEDTLVVSAVGITVNSPPVFTFSVIANGLQAVSGLTTSNVRFSLVKLVANGTAAGQHWESYINTAEDPVCRSAADVSSSQNACTTFTAATDPALVLDSDLKVSDTDAPGRIAVAQATTENNGTLTQASDGNWSYQFNTDIGDPATLSEVHRACIQFSLPVAVDNLCVDFVPALLADSATAAMGSSLSPLFYDTNNARLIATEATCNSCHAKLALHGGGRTQLDFCVTCHNPGTSDANSTNNLDLATMVHKIHNGRNLPGGVYKIWGYRNGEHDFSNTTYPQTMTNCTRCHAGQEDIDFATAQGLPMPEAQITADGHNWVTNPTLRVCTSCHEQLLTGTKLDGTAIGRDHSTFTDDTNCAGCHRDRGADAPGALQANQAHRDLLREAGKSLTLVIENVAQAGVGETPLVDISVQDATGVVLDLLDTAVFCATATFDVRIAWDGATEFLNLDDAGVGATSPRISAAVNPAALTRVGSTNVFTINTNSASVIPAGTSSIAVMISTRYPGPDDTGTACAGTGTVYLDSVVKFVATSGGTAQERRQIVDVNQCNHCHGRFQSDITGPSFHPNVGVNNPLVCAGCHNPNRRTTGSSHDLSVTVHAVHASGYRETPFKGTWTGERLQFPGDLSDCAICHTGNSQLLPLPLVREAVTSETGLFTTPVAAVCSSCHDGAVAKAHMESQGNAQFDVTVKPDMNVTPETCSVCHGQGASADVDVVHKR